MLLPRTSLGWGSTAYRECKHRHAYYNIPASPLCDCLISPPSNPPQRPQFRQEQIPLPPILYQPFHLSKSTKGRRSIRLRGLAWRSPNEKPCAMRYPFVLIWTVNGKTKGRWMRRGLKRWPGHGGRRSCSGRDCFKNEEKGSRRSLRSIYVGGSPRNVGLATAALLARRRAPRRSLTSFVDVRLVALVLPLSSRFLPISGHFYIIWHHITTP